MGSGSTPGARRLLLCYVSGLDLRRVDHRTTPFLARALQSRPWTRLLNLPSNELFPTLVTGVDPSEHGVWGVRLGHVRTPTRRERIVDLLPDLVTTSWQCVRHLLNGTFDLAAIPPRRRRRLELTRTKYRRRSRDPEALLRIGGITTVLGALGEPRSRYVFSASGDPTARLLPHLGRGGHDLEIVELYSLDRFQQWNLDRPEAVSRFYALVDGFLEGLHDRCGSAGISVMLLSDHGHEPVRESVDLVARLSGLGLPGHEYDMFVEVSNARFWFHTKRAREAVTGALGRIGGGSLLGWQEMRQHGVPLADPSYGELFLFLEPGRIFFPHDFHHPLANLWLGLTDPMQRSRLRDPRHRGNHGHLPGSDAEVSFVVLLDPTFETEDGEATILDIAPSILAILGHEPPPSMKGRRLFRPRGGS